MTTAGVLNAGTDIEKVRPDGCMRVWVWCDATAVKTVDRWIDRSIDRSINWSHASHTPAAAAAPTTSPFDPSKFVPPPPFPHTRTTRAQGENARMASFIGAIAIADLVKTTLGPKGMDKILQSVSKQARAAPCGEPLTTPHTEAGAGRIIDSVRPAAAGRTPTNDPTPSLYLLHLGELSRRRGDGDERRRHHPQGRAHRQPGGQGPGGHRQDAGNRGESRRLDACLLGWLFA
jgi:hypothetical protein